MPALSTPGSLFDQAQHLVEIRIALLSGRIPAVGIDANRRGSRGLEAHVDVEHADQAANQQTRADQQHAGERDLRHDQRVPRPSSAGGPRSTRASRPSTRS